MTDEQAAQGKKATILRTEWVRGMHDPFECGCCVLVEPSTDIPGEATLFLLPCPMHKQELVRDVWSDE